MRHHFFLLKILLQSPMKFAKSEKLLRSMRFRNCIVVTFTSLRIQHLPVLQMEELQELL
jgi:hypothetical protein